MPLGTAVQLCGSNRLESREAWAKVMSAELSEAAVVREAQQRAELLCHRSSEGRAQLEEARREKQRMTAEYEGLAKQDMPGSDPGTHQGELDQVGFLLTSSCFHGVWMI